MASIDDELLKAEEENRKEIAFIRKQLPQELKLKYSDELLEWMLDAIADYYIASDVFDTDADEVDIDMEQVAAHVCQQAQEQKRDRLEPEEVFFVVEADLDFQEQSE